MESVDKEITHQIIKLLQEARLSTENLTILPFDLGGNNQTFRVQTIAGVFVAKKYFSHHDDKRDRLASEFSFLSFVQDITKEMVPRAIAKLPVYNIALYEFIEGLPLAAGEISQKEVNTAVDFFCKINQPQFRQAAKNIPKASEACFSIEDHISLIKNRINQLLKINTHTTYSNTIHEYANRLNAHLEQLKKSTLKSNLLPEQWCISPSDFGFHNALKRNNNNICFIDFEYAGWDDPAKMAADFFSQLAVPVPPKYFETFVKQSMSCFPHANDLVERAFFLRPIYQIKWCCIALNIFLPYHLERRKFANKDLNLIELQQNQLTKAKKILDLLENEYVQC